MIAAKNSLILCVLLLLSSCNKKEDLIGVWKLEKVDIEQAIAEFKGEQKEFARLIMQDAFDNVKGRMKMTFFENKKYTIETPLLDGKIKTDKGTWKFSLNRKKLNLKNAEGKESHNILKLNDKIFIIEMEQAGFGAMKMTFIH